MRSTARHARELAPGPERAVRRAPAARFVDHPERFYQEFSTRPVVLEGALGASERAAGFTLEALAARWSTEYIEGYSHATGEREAVPARAFFTALREGRGAHNVVDHPVVSTHLRGLLAAPGFLRSNWLPTDRPELEVSPLGLTISPAGAFTPLHIDAYGMQGWMLLSEGCKHWTFIAPEHARPRLDPSSAELPGEPSAWAGVPRDIAAARDGDLVFIPPGWAHQVFTERASLGVGGSAINEHQLVATMRSWLAERACGVCDELDVAALARAAEPALTSASARGAVREALALYEAWLSAARARAS